MVETGNWLVPHIWYVPHLDKPPFTYWAVAASLSVFGVNEWAVRLPLALAGLSAAWATFLLVRSVAGAAAGRVAVLVFVTAALAWVMSRMLTTDIFLTQFIAWAIYCFWQSWRSLDPLVEPSAVSRQQGAKADEDEADPAADARGRAAKRSFAWQLGAWAAIALVIPLGAFGVLVLWRSRRPANLSAEDFTLEAFGPLRWAQSVFTTPRNSILLLGALAGGTLFLVLALPWFWAVWATVPDSFAFMVKGQVVGHAVQGAAKNRAQPFWFFIPVLLAGFLPWTPLLGWLWRRAHWRSLDARTQEVWLVLTVWAGLTFAVFSINTAKLMHYILPMFPALAALVALRWNASVSEVGRALPHPDPLPLGEGTAKDARGASERVGSVPPLTASLPLPAGEGRSEGESEQTTSTPPWLWRALPAAALLPLLAFPLACRFVFKVHDQVWVKVAAGGAGAVLLAALWESRKWSAALCARWAGGMAAVSLLVVAGLMPLVETELRSNQTLKPLGLALKREFREGDVLIVRHRIPQGLPFYAHPVISATRRPYLSGLPEHRMPFEFPGNRARFGDRVLKDDQIYGNFLAGQQRVFVVGFKGSYSSSRPLARGKPLRLIAQVGDWELFSNR
jgi:4-amino-4-deoxy-L-arabinose transferase-like glycosyltransferase